MGWELSVEEIEAVGQFEPLMVILSRLKEMSH